MSTAKQPPIKRREQPRQAQSPKLQTTPIRVRATRLGYYEHKRRRPGDVFIFAAPVVDGAAILPSWLEEATAAPLKETGAQAALTAAADDARASGAAAPAGTASSGDDLGI